MVQLNTGLSENDRSQMSQGVSKLLADTYLLYIKTHKFHWNVKGPQFQELHKMFEEQYLHLAEAADVIAERIRALGSPAPGSYEEFNKLTSIKEEPGNPKTQEMISQLVEGHEIIARNARDIVKKADEMADEATVDLLTERMKYHEKTAWMLRSLLEQ